MASLTTVASWALLTGLSVVAKYLSSCGPVRQWTAGVLPPTPRGSNPTTSNRARTAADTTWRACSAYWIPDPPGPPGLITSDPIRRAGSLAGSLITGSENRRQPGRW